jgi:hypothetical protein
MYAAVVCIFTEGAVLFYCITWRRCKKPTKEEKENNVEKGNRLPSEQILGYQEAWLVSDGVGIFQEELDILA